MATLQPRSSSSASSSALREALERAQQELKRADHLIYVSLKYTRTVDVLKSILDRLVNAIDAGLDALLIKARQDKRISEVPRLPRLKIEQVKKAYADNEKLLNYLEFYSLLRKIGKASFSRAQEYRRHVTMTAILDDKKIEITIDIISDYFHKIKEFLALAESIVEGEE